MQICAELILKIAGFVEIDDILQLLLVNKFFNSVLAIHQLILNLISDHSVYEHPILRKIYCLPEYQKYVFDVKESEWEWEELCLEMDFRIPRFSNYLSFYDLKVNEMHLACPYLWNCIVQDPNFQRNVDPSEHHNLAIRMAVTCDHVELVRILLKDSRVDPAVGESEIFSIACSLQRVEIVEMLLKDSRIDPTAKNDTAIKTACLEGSPEIMKLILGDGRCNPDGLFPIAVTQKHTEIVKLLIEDGRCRLDSVNNFALRHCAETGNVEIMKLLLQRLNPSVDENTLCIIACVNGHYEIARMLMDHPNFKPHSLSHIFACSASNASCFPIFNQLLDDERVNVNIRNTIVMRVAIENSNIPVIKALLKDPRIDPTANDNEALKLASHLKNIEIRNILLQDDRVKAVLMKQ